MANGQGKPVERNETTKFLSPKRLARASLAQTERSCLASSVSVPGSGVR